MRISDVLRNKGAAVATITPETSVAGLLTELNIHNIGAMVVVAALVMGSYGRTRVTLESWNLRSMT